MLNNKLLLSVVLAAAVPLSAQATISVDGDIGDWIDLGSIDNSWNNTSSYVYKNGNPNPAEGNEWNPLRSTTSYVISDTSNSNNEIYQDTNGSANYSSTSSSGGQSYDAEAMYLEIQNDTLYVAIVTGLAPDNSRFSAGDIFFDLNGDIGKNSGNGYEYGMVVADHDSNISQGNSFYDGNSWDAGELYSLTDWNDGINSPASGLHPVTGRTGSEVTGAATSLAYNSNMVNGIGPFDYANASAKYIENDHYFIEASISLVDNSGVYNAFGQSLIDSIDNGTDINVHWNPLCNNDWIQFTGTLAGGGGGSNQVPEPAPLALLAIGFVGMAARKKYRKV